MRDGFYWEQMDGQVRARPSMKPDDDKGKVVTTAWWPETLNDEWCGEWRAKEQTT